jgi:hypothetical protein
MSLHRFKILFADSYTVIYLVTKGDRPQQIHSTSRTASISTPSIPPHHPIYNQQKKHKTFPTRSTSITQSSTLNPSSPKPPSPSPLQTLYSGPSSLHPSYPHPHPQSTPYQLPTQSTPQPPKTKRHLKETFPPPHITTSPQRNTKHAQTSMLP